MSATAITADKDNDVRHFHQLVVDAVELAGAISPSLKAQLVSVLGETFPAEISPTIEHQKASLPAVLRMFVYARHEADQLSDLQYVRQPLDICVAFLIDRASYDQSRATNQYH